MEINREILQSLADEVNKFPQTMWSGMSTREIMQRGSYQEEKLVLGKEDLPLGQLYAGLAALARDMHIYLTEHPREDAGAFENVVTEVSAEDSGRYGTGAFPQYDGQPVSLLPSGLALTADSGKPVVSPLGDPRIVHEWTSKPGKKLFERFIQKFGRKLRETICGQNGPYEQFNKGLIGQAALPTTIAGSILTVGFSAATFWYPLAMYLAILLVKTGLKTFCER